MCHQKPLQNSTPLSQGVFGTFKVNQRPAEYWSGRNGEPEYWSGSNDKPEYLSDRNDEPTNDIPSLQLI